MRPIAEPNDPVDATWIMLWHEFWAAATARQK
jgi:hypothetical protein